MQYQTILYSFALPIFSQRTANQSHEQQAKLRNLEDQIDGLRNTLKEAEAQAVKVISPFHKLAFCFVLFSFCKRG